MKLLARQVAEETVKETLIRLGIDTTRPLETQKDFSFLRSQRVGYEQLGAKVKMTLLGILISSAAVAIWYGIKVALKGTL